MGGQTGDCMRINAVGNKGMDRRTVVIASPPSLMHLMMVQVLICHLFYLPYEHGPRATAMLQSVAWLLDHLPPPVNVPELHSPLSPSSSSDDDDDAR